MRINCRARTPNPQTAKLRGQGSRNKDSHGDGSNRSEQVAPKECSHGTGGVLVSQGHWLGSLLPPRPPPPQKRQVGRQIGGQRGRFVQVGRQVGREVGEQVVGRQAGRLVNRPIGGLRRTSWFNTNGGLASGASRGAKPHQYIYIYIYIYGSFLYFF